MKRDIELFGAILFFFSAFPIAVTLALSGVSVIHDTNVLIVLAILMPVAILGVFIAWKKSFLLLAISCPFTLLLAFLASGFFAGSHDSSWNYVVPFIIFALFNFNALVGAWQLRQYRLKGIVPPVENRKRYWLFRGGLIAFALAYIPLRYQLLNFIVS